MCSVLPTGAQVAKLGCHSWSSVLLRMVSELEGVGVWRSRPWAATGEASGRQGGHCFQRDGRAEPGTQAGPQTGFPE